MTGATGERLDAAIIDVVGTAQPAVGRTRAVQILRGGRSKVVEQNGYDELPEYGAFAQLHADDVLGRVDELIQAGRLVSDRRALPEARAGEGGGVKVGVLASGRGTNLQALIDRFASGPAEEGIEIVAVGSDQPDAPALRRARAAQHPRARVRARRLP